MEFRVADYDRRMPKRYWFFSVIFSESKINRNYEMDSEAHHVFRINLSISISMKIILGSKSPRRKELLNLLGYSFELRTLDTDESFPLDLPISEIPVYIANKKAEALLPSLVENELLITADTIVVLNNEVLGKPMDAADAKEMLAKLSGKTHQVITGVCVNTLEKSVHKSVTTKVSFKDLSPSEIHFYVENYKPFDKAGSYGIQEYIGLIGIEKIEGSYTNVVGLPTAELAEMLKSFE